MFDLHARGDIEAYLASQGFTVNKSEHTLDLRAAANLCSQVVALERSITFNQVMAHAEKVLRMQSADITDEAEDS